MKWEIRADWKVGKKDVHGNPLKGSIGCWTGYTKRDALVALQTTLESNDPFYVDRRQDLTNFRIEKL